MTPTSRNDIRTSIEDIYGIGWPRRRFKNVTAVFVQSAFRGRNDDGNETTATWKANENTNWTQLVDSSFRIRIEVEETATASPANNLNMKFQYNRNSAGWVDIGASTTIVKTAASTNYSDGDLTTNQLTTSTRTFQAGTMITDTVDPITSPTFSSASNENVENEICLTIVGTDVNDGDTIQIRLVKADGTALDTYSQTPTITVNKPGAAFANPEILGRPYGHTGQRQMRQLLPL